jgi:Flp pilus assembly protein TadG
MLSKGERRAGVVLVLAALSLVAMLGIVAIALDGGLLLSQKRSLQAAADAAALAAATDLFNKASPDTANRDAQAVATTNLQNSFPGNLTRPTTTVNIPPSSGNYANPLDGPACAEVIIQYTPQSYFSAIFGAGVTPPITARAVARGPYNRAVILLDPNGGSLPNVNTNGKVVVASVIDPLLYLPEPDPNSLPVRTRNTLKITGNNPVTLDPGVYIGGIVSDGNGNVTMNSGVYYMQGGGFSFTGEGNLIANGILLFSQGAIDISPHQSAAQMSPLTSGPYQGITVYLDRYSGASVNLTGNGLANITGTIYAANSVLTVNEGSSGDSLGTQYICDRLYVPANTVTVNYSPGSSGKTRALGLVE